MFFEFTVNQMMSGSKATRLLLTAPLFIATKCTQILPSVVFGALLPRIFKQNALENTLRDSGCE